MKKKADIEERAWEILSAEAEKLGVIPVDAELQKTGGECSLLLTIDKEGGVMIDDCEALSRAIDPILDAENFIEEAYTLYVSSPGLGRKLRRPRDFIFAKGKEIELHFYKAIDGDKEMRGILKEADGTSLLVEVDGSEKTIHQKDCSSIALAFDF